MSWNEEPKGDANSQWFWGCGSVTRCPALQTVAEFQFQCEPVSECDIGNAFVTSATNHECALGHTATVVCVNTVMPCEPLMNTIKCVWEECTFILLLGYVMNVKVTRIDSTVHLFWFLTDYLIIINRFPTRCVEISSCERWFVYLLKTCSHILPFFAAMIILSVLLKEEKIQPKANKRKEIIRTRASISGNENRIIVKKINRTGAGVIA